MEKGNFTIKCLLILLIFIFGCKELKEISPETDDISTSLNIEEAKAWFEANSESKKSQRANKSRFSHFETYWGKATAGKNTGNDYVEVPLKLSDTSAIKLAYRENNKIRAIDTRKLWLVLYRDEKGQMQERIKQLYPDDSTSKKFSGRIMLWNWDGRLMGGNRVINGEPVSRIYSGEPPINGKTNVLVCEQYLMCAWYRGCSGPDNNYVEIQDIKIRGENGICYYPQSWDFPYPWYNGPNCNAWNYSYSDIFTECWEDGTEYDPGAGGGGETNPTPTPTLDKIVWTHNLSSADLAKLENLLNEYIANCLGKSIYDWFPAYNRYLNFEIDGSISSPGAFVPSTNTVKFRSSNDMTLDVLREEIFHGYQHYGSYPNGLQQYDNVGRSNIEFEAKLGTDITKVILGEGCCMTVNDPTYYIWLLAITDDGTKYPTAYSDFNNQYFHFLELFKINNPAYNFPTNNSLTPSLLLNVINRSNCPK